MRHQDKPGLKGLVVSCPANDGTTQTCSISNTPDQHVDVQCLTCGTKADVFQMIDLVRKVNPEWRFPDILKTARSIAKSVVDPNVIHEQVHALLDAYPLPETGPVAEYLRSRRLFEMAQNDGWGAFPFGKDDGSLAAAVQQIAPALGLTSSKGKLVSPAHVILMPWRDSTGRISQLQRSDIGRRAPVSLPNAPFTHPYGIERLLPNETAVLLVEGPMNVLAARALSSSFGGKHVVLGIPGPNSWQHAWTPALSNRNVTLAFEQSRAGGRREVDLWFELHMCGALASAGASRFRAHRDWVGLLDVWS